MHSRETVAEVLSLRKQGLGARRIARATGLPVSTVQGWLVGKLPKRSLRFAPDGLALKACAQCGHDEHRFKELPPEYVYLLGLYLGDGHVASHRRGVYRLRIFLDLKYPGIIEECAQAMRAVVPENKVSVVPRRSGFSPKGAKPSLAEVGAFSKSWPCLFPQHGPGMKHTRWIWLVDWQRELAERWPQLLLRGLIHSDGCRFINTGKGGWSAPRYAFANTSTDILEIFCTACDRLGLRWTEAPKRIYVSRQADVARMDEFIGPKR